LQLLNGAAVLAHAPAGTATRPVAAAMPASVTILAVASRLSAVSLSANLRFIADRRHSPVTPAFITIVTLAKARVYTLLFEF
jgi:hypothetical protein